MEELLIAAISLFVGAFLARRTNHEKWLLECRTEAFSEYFRLYDKAFVTAVPLVAKTPQNNDLQLEIMDAYQPLLTHSKIVRMDLRERVRDEFSELTDSLWKLHSQSTGGGSKVYELGNIVERIQAIFEAELSPPTAREILQSSGRNIRSIFSGISA